MIVVTGANGAFGGLVVEQLLARIPASDLAVSVRDTVGAARIACRGVDVRHGDFDRPETLPKAFAGADTVLINGTNYGAAPQVRARQQAAALQAAQAVGATRIVITSWQDLDNCPLETVSDFPETESLVAASGASWTVLRLTYGMSASLARDVQSALTVGTLAAPAGGARATPAAVGDLADATANVLSGIGHDGKTYELTGPDAITWDDLATLATTLAGKEIGYRPVPDEEFRDQVLATGFSAPVIDMLVAYYQAFRAGWASTPSPDLGHLLRRQPTASLDAVRQAVAL
ncbi:NAD(P)H-binding protein [Streptomyces sp. FXJ1.172]|uniref:NAD(P)H-binding protein n=1 Tax=Streptomyces sp. FXJ1.172 TaxID=710705 RepID=UPI0007CF8881|nr:NAD(P)H-binding protein [Streptomyces sp. FXJ1.172]WEO92927.1 NAD(P)H-binding protein [Streptomyces sp. FXJ1.172]